MNNNNPYINAYLQQQGRAAPVSAPVPVPVSAPVPVPVSAPVHPQQSVYEVPAQMQAKQPQEYVPKYAIRSAVTLQQADARPFQQATHVSQQVPREYHQFPTQQPQSQQPIQSATQKDNYSSLNVFDQQVLKNSLEAEKVAPVDRRTFESQITTAQKTREEIDKQLAAGRTAAATVAPTTIKVEKKTIDNFDTIAARRNQEAAQLKVEKVTNDASALLGAMAVKKTDPSQLNKQMDDLIKRRQMEMQNIKYN